MRHFIALLLTTCTLGSHTVTAQAAVGKTSGSFNVSSTGAATYSIPIWAPPGPQGLQPHLALSYNHRGGGGVLGIGWQLAGLSAINRCNKTLIEDGAAGAVTLTYNDVFCLDGKRIRLTSSDSLSTYGQDGTTYQTEIADFSNVTAHGAQGNGPSYFTVQGKDGLTYEYGNGGYSQVKGTDAATTAVSWYLDKITDRSGNTLVVSYLAPSNTLTGTTLPSSIQWTPVSQGATTYSYSIAFAYTPTNLPASSIAGYVAGTAVVNQELMTSISIQNSSSATIKQYVLGYDTSPTTGGYRLTSVKECADSAASNCLIPTSITYQPGSAGVSTSATTFSFGGSTNWMFSTFDFNGDGFTDLLYQVGTTWYVALGSPSGYGAGQSTGVTTPAYIFGQYLLPGDLLGSGKDGFLAKNGTDWWYYTLNGSSFSGVDTNIAYDTASANFALADVNGDGLPDLASVHWSLSASVTAYVNLNSGGGVTASFGSPITAFNFSDSRVGGAYLVSPATQEWGGVRRFDFNGDGNEDLGVQITLNTLKGSTSYALYGVEGNGTSFSSSSIYQSADGAQPIFVNWNNDACTDVIHATTLVISACNGTVASAFTLANRPISVMDWNGDGLMDFVYKSGTTLSVQLSTGQGPGAIVTTNITLPTATTPLPMDVNGDGLDELGIWSGTSLTYYPHNGANQPPDLLSSVSDGYGISFNPTYTSILLGSYAASSNVTGYPEINYHAPLSVVSQVSSSDGIGGTYTSTYSYVGARKHLKGYGFEGFESVTTGDSRLKSLVNRTLYKQLFPLTGMPLEVDTYQHNGVTPVSQTTFTNLDTTLHGTAFNERHFPHVDSSTAHAYEVEGPINGAPITTTSRVNTFDNYGNLTNVATTVTDDDATSLHPGQQWTSTTATTFSVDTGSNWCLSQPTLITVTNTAPNVATRTRTTGFGTPVDYAHCRPISVITEPGNSSYELTKTISYDGFGNVNGVTVSGPNITTRTSTVDWGTTGQFPVTVRDAMSNSLGSAGYQTVNGYDYNLGVQTSQVTQSAVGMVANAPPTNWHYDVFGRKAQEIRPDGTSTDWVYSDCATVGGCLVGSHALVVTSHVYNTDQATVQTDGAIYYDQLDRPIASNRRMLQNGGAYERVDTQYDNFGRTSRVSMPCVWSTLTTMCPYGTTNGYDAIGRVISIQRPISASNTTLQSTTLQYAGRTTVETDPYGKTKTKISTVVGTLALSQDHDGYHQNFTYDAFGSLLSVTDSLSRTLFTAGYDYGIAPFQRDATDMDLDVSTATGQHRHYNYDALGELTSWSDAKGQSFTETYDFLSRPLVRTEPDLTTTYTYGTSVSDHNIGRLQSVSAGSYSESYVFDPDGRLANRSVSAPSPTNATYSYDFTYDSTSGRLATLTYPTSTSSYRLKLAYSYQNGILQAVSDFNAGTVFWQANSTNARGQVTQETLGNGVVTNRTFDDVTGTLSTMTSGVSGTAALQNESYLYDNVGNLWQRQNNNAGLTENFYYDDLYRLDHSSLNGTVNLQMGYSPDGNITSRSDLAGGATWTYDATHKHAVTQAGSVSNSYTYDANGNAMSRNGVGITWTSYNHPSLINGAGESVQFAYNQNHERWSAVYSGSAGTETTYLMGGLLEKVVTAGGAADYRHYIFAGGVKVAIYSRTTGGVNTLRYIREDHLGGADAILASDGSSYVKESFTAFGARRNACTWSGPPTNGTLTKINAVSRHGYTWQTALGAMGLNDMNGRIQDATTGRFLSADPYVNEPDLTQGFNRYSYVMNNPLTYIDPSGFDGEVVVNGKRPTDGYNPNLDWKGNGTRSGGGGTGGSGGGGGAEGLAEVIVTPPPKEQVVILNGVSIVAPLETVVIHHDDRANPYGYGDDVISDIGSVFSYIVEGTLHPCRPGVQCGVIMPPDMPEMETVTVIGRTEDLKSLAPGERAMMERLQPSLGNPRANWMRNFRVLREEMRRGLPIRDASIGDQDGVWLNAERMILEWNDWALNEETGYWVPPIPKDLMQ